MEEAEDWSAWAIIAREALINRQGPYAEEEGEEEED
jgi:hypothetical protein